MKKLYILDASGYLYRAYFAIRQMTNSKGESTNALFGFIRSVLKLIKDFHPSHIVSVFDGPTSTSSRKSLYADYKIHRKGMPQDLYYQIAWAYQFCHLIGIPTLMIPDVEADDTMGSVALWAAEHGSEVFLCTSDKDMSQLVKDHIFLLNTHKDNLILDASGVEQQYGVRPNQMIDFLAITGDASDNVPGLTGFGPKTAADLLKKYGTLDYILDHPTVVSGIKKQETIIQERDKVLLGRRLVTIDTSVAFEKNEEFFKLKTLPRGPLREFYASMNFSSLLRELEAENVEMPILENQESEKVEELDYQLVNDLSTLEKVVELLSKEKEIGLHIEATSPHPIHSLLVGVALAVKPKQAWYFPLNGQLELSIVLNHLKSLFENQEIAFFGHNIKHDTHVLLNYDIHIANILFDTTLASYLLNSHSRQHTLEVLMLDQFSKVRMSLQDLLGKGKKQISIEEVPIEKMSLYCCEAVDYTVRLKGLLFSQLTERKLSSLYNNLELPLISILRGMERRGIYIDSDYLQTLSLELAEDLSTLKDEIYALAGESFNLNSPKQLSEVLFVKLGIQPPKKTATGFSTNADVLETLKQDYPIASKLLEYRTLEKLRSTYIETLPHVIHPITNRVHCTFNQSLAATGRLSCQDPNLQNIPVRTEIGRKIREAFKPQLTNWSYLAADYSQIELRLLAHLSEDEVLIHAFESNEDIHNFTASQIFNVPIDQVTSEQRYQAKTVNFGLMYGQQAYGLSQELGIDPKTAAQFIQKYFERYHKVKDFFEKNKQQAHKEGKAVTLMGRERLIPEISSSNAMIRAMAERLAVNTPIQGSQADLIKKAMLEIDRELKEKNLRAYLILQIHDELLFEVPDEELEEVRELVLRVMSGVVKLKIPLVVDIHIGKNWKEC